MIRLLEYVLARAVLFLLQSLPYAAATALARTVAHRAFRLDAQPRARAIANLRLAYGGALADGQENRITAGVYETIARHVAEIAHVTRQARQGLRIENPEILSAASALGRGVVLVSAHFGCWVRMAVIPRVFGVRAAVIMKKQQNDRLLQWGIGYVKRHFGLDVISKREARARVVPLLRSGYVVGFFADQHPRNGGFPARFFGRTIKAAAGPAVYAKRLGCPLVVFTATLLPDGSHLLRFDGPLSTDGSHDEISQQWVSLLEARIREHPEQWTWMHRRWRALTPADFEPPPYAKRLA